MREDLPDWVHWTVLGFGVGTMLLLVTGLVLFALALSGFKNV